MGDLTEVAQSSFGLGSYVATRAVVRCARIGRFTSIGDNVRFCLAAHPTRTHVSTHPLFWIPQTEVGPGLVRQAVFESHRYVDDERRFTVDIGNDVWIGSNALVMDGVRIGNGAVVAAGSVVTKDVPAYAIAAGIPARVQRYRFDASHIAFLEGFRWWDKDWNWLRENAHLFADINAFQSAMTAEVGQA